MNDFIDRGRVKRVYVQGDPASRMQPEDLNRWYVRNNKGEMVPFSAFGRGEWTYGPQKLVRFNGVPAYQIQGAPAPGRSSGEAMDAMEELVAKLPAGVGLEWNGLSFEERAVRLAGAAAVRAVAGHRVPVSGGAVRELVDSVSGAAGGAAGRARRRRSPRWRAGSPNDAYFQVGLLDHHRLWPRRAPSSSWSSPRRTSIAAWSWWSAVVHAAQQRLRPILMTSLAFMSGVLPLAISSGAGSGAQHAVGTGVIGGMLAATFLAIFFVPVFFVVVLAVLQGEADDGPAELDRLRVRTGVRSCRRLGEGAHP